MKSCVSLVLAALAFVGCGRDDGYVYKQSKFQNIEPLGNRPAFELTKSSYSELTWFWQCPSDPVEAPAAAPGGVVLVDSGPHGLYRERMISTPLKFKGNVCPARQYERDVVIAVDISGSMPWMDPVDGGSCQRSRAVNDILDSLPSGSRMAVVLFEEEIRAASTRFFANKNDLFENLLPQLTGPLVPANPTIEQVICYAEGATDYKLGMEKAKSILETGRGNATKKELYVIADGDPIDSGAVQEQNRADAVAIATDLKTNGVAIDAERIVPSIGTLRIENPSELVRDIILTDLASLDSGNQPLMRKLTTANLEAVTTSIGSLAENKLESAKLKYQVVGAGDWTTIDLLAILDNRSGEFESEPIRLRINGQQVVYETQLEYWDTHGSRVTVEGKIEWRD